MQRKSLFRIPLLIFGAGGHGRVVADTAMARGVYDVVGFVDSSIDVGTVVYRGIRVVANDLGGLGNDYLLNHIVVAVGDNAIRNSLFCEAREMFIINESIVHPTAVISPSAHIGSGTVVFANAVINAGAYIGNNVIINTKASIDHDCVIGDHSHICPGATIAGNVSVGEGSQISVGCSVRNAVSIGKWSLVGVGSVVVNDIPDSVVSYGCPARVVKQHNIGEV